MNIFLFNASNDTPWQNRAPIQFQVSEWVSDGV